MISVLALGLPVLLAVIASFVMGVVMIIGAQKMMRLESYGWAMTASVLALLPCNPVGLLGLVVGIWSLVVLNRRGVKEAFAGGASGRLTSPPSPPGLGVRPRSPVVLLLLSVMLLFLAAVGFYAARSNKSNLGTLEIHSDAGIRGLKVLVRRDGQQVTMIDAQTRSWTSLEPGVYQLILVGGSTVSPAGAPPGRLELSQSSITVSPGTRQVVRVSVLHVPDSPAAAPGPALGWSMGPGGPVLTDSASAWLKLKPAQVEAVNKVLQTSYQEFLALEAKNIERNTDDAGHVVIIIKAFPQGFARLEDQLWSRLDAIFDREQQSVARLNLKLDAPEGQPGMTISDLVRPGFFGWANDGARIEIWRVGSWSHWKIKAHGYETSGRAPQLPQEYRRFWKEPAAPPAAATKDESKN